jgi:hypothetical protein
LLIIRKSKGHQQIPFENDDKKATVRAAAGLSTTHRQKRDAPVEMTDFGLQVRKARTKATALTQRALRKLSFAK